MSAPSVSAALTALAALAIPLALTEAVELGFAAAVRRTGRGLGAVALVNVLTNPPVNALYALTTAVAGLPAVPAAAVLEAAAVAAEGAVYRAWGGFLSLIHI